MRNSTSETHTRIAVRPASDCAVHSYTYEACAELVFNLSDDPPALWPGVDRVNLDGADGVTLPFAL